MNIVHILTSLKIGGAERFVIDLCEIQKTQSLNPRIIAFGEKSEPLLQECAHKQIAAHQIKTNLLQRNYNLWQQLKSADIIHIHSPYALKACLVPLMFVPGKVIYTRHGEAEFSQTSWKIIHRVAQGFIRHISFVSKKGLDVFKKNHSLKRPLHVIENGANTDVSNNIFPSSKLRLGSVGRMVSLKQQLNLLKALKLLAPPIADQIEIHFFGDGECLAQLQAFNQQQVKSGKVIFHGVVTDRDSIYNNFDVLVVTSSTEGLSLAIIEAMTFKHPCIASKVGGNPRLVIPNQTGFLFEHSNIEELATHIKNMVINRELIVQMGNNARKHIVENFSLRTTHHKYLELYQN